MTKKTTILGIASLAILGMATFIFGASAYRGDAGVKGPNYTPERHEAMQKAFESGDYKAWKDSMNGRGRVSEVINEQNFKRFAEMHQLMLDGKNEEANVIRQELGLGHKNGQGKGMGKRGQGRGGNFADANGDGVCDRMQ